MGGTAEVQFNNRASPILITCGMINDAVSRNSSVGIVTCILTKSGVAAKWRPKVHPTGIKRPEREAGYLFVVPGSRMREYVPFLHQWYSTWGTRK